MTKVAYIRWRDAKGDSGPRDIELANKEGAIAMETAGIYLSEDDEVVRVAQDIYNYNEWASQSVREVEVILKKNITHMKVTEHRRAK